MKNNVFVENSCRNVKEEARYAQRFGREGKGLDWIETYSVYLVALAENHREKAIR